VVATIRAAATVTVRESAGVYIGRLGTFAFEASTIIVLNDASTSNDDIFPCAIPEANLTVGNRGVGVAEGLEPGRTGGRSAF
jgi:hypothetical protein